MFCHHGGVGFYYGLYGLRRAILSASIAKSLISSPERRPLESPKRQENYSTDVGKVVEFYPSIL